MRKVEDLTGQKFGRWTVLKFSRLDQGSRWLCKCDCGIERVVRRANLIKGDSSSCGCYNRERSSEVHSKPLEEVAITQIYNSYKQGAKEKDRTFSLTKDDVKILCQQICYYCKSKPSNVLIPNRKKQQFLYSGIDRIDNTKGYTIDNCVPCCKFCNQAKHTHPYQEFIDWINKLKQS